MPSISGQPKRPTSARPKPSPQPGSKTAVFSTRQSRPAPAEGLPLPDAVVRRVAQSDLQARRAAALAELVGEVSAAQTPREAGDHLVDAVGPAVGASVTAWCRLRRGRPVVESVAGRRHVEASGPTADLIEAAAEEALLADRPLLDREDAADDRALALRAVREEFRTAGAVACPVGERGVLVLAGPLDASAVDWLAASAGPLGGVMTLLGEARGSRLKAIARVPGRRWLMAVAAAGVVTGVMMVPVRHTLDSAAVLTPASRRVAVAPFEGILEDVSVEAGDVVSAGQTLAVMDGRQIRWEQSGLRAEQAAALKRRDRATAAGDITEAQLAELEARGLRRRADLLADRESRLSVTAAVDGVVLAAEYERQSSVPVRTGDPLFDVAPLSPLRVEVAVPAEDFAHLRVGQTAEVALDGGGTVEGTLRAVRPQSEVRDGRNVFVARFDVDNGDGLLRPGQTGTAAVNAGRRSLGWVLFHRLAERFEGWRKTRF